MSGPDRTAPGGGDPPFGRLLVEAAARRPHADALVVGAERRTTVALRDAAWATARSLVGLGVRGGDRVGLLLANSVRFAVTAFGIGLAGGVVVPLDTRYRTDDLRAVLTGAGLTALVTSDDTDRHTRFADLLVAALGDGIGEHPAPVLVLAGRGAPRGFVDLAEFEAAGERVADDEVGRRWRAVAPGDPGIVFHTSGTTAAPRAITHSQAGFVRLWRASLNRLRLAEGEALWSPLPLTHISGLGPLTACLGRGATYVTDVAFDPSRALAAIRAERPTVLYPAFPPLLEGLLDEPSCDVADLADARAVLAVGPPETLRRFAAALPAAVMHSTYGLTEAGGPVALSRPDQDLDARTTTSGPPVDGVEVCVVGEDGGVAGVGEEGELWFRDVGGEWTATGDRGTLDAAGDVVFRGRADDRLKVGGENVAPAEVEAHLTTHPWVRTVQVVGAPDPRLGEVVAAFVELEPAEGAAAPPDAEELVAYCRGRLAGYKVPRHVRFVTDWPMSTTKIQRFRLRERIAAELAEGL